MRKEFYLLAATFAISGCKYVVDNVDNYPSETHINSNKDSGVGEIQDSRIQYDSNGRIRDVLFDTRLTDLQLRDSNSDTHIREDNKDVSNEITDSILIDVNDSQNEIKDSGINSIDVDNVSLDSRIIDAQNEPRDVREDVVPLDSMIDSRIDSRVDGNEDLSDIGTDAQEDARIERCYSNNFSDDSYLEDFVFQNGVWVRNRGGYLQQTRPLLEEEFGRALGIKAAYLNRREFTNLDARVRVSIPESSGLRTSDIVHLLFRYSPERQDIYNDDTDRGYSVALERAQGGRFNFIIEDFYHARLATTPVNAELGWWYELRVRINQNNIEGYFQGERLLEIQDDSFATGKVGLATHASRGDFDDFEVCSIDE